MPPTEARRHRSAVARVVYMAQDRPDLDVVACTLAAHPKIGDELVVKRVCRFVKGGPRYAQFCEYQGEAQELVVQTVTLHPLADQILEAVCFEVVIYFIVGAGFEPGSLSALQKLSCTRKRKVYMSY